MARKRKKIKHGRNKKSCERYRLEGRYFKNKRKKLEKHLKRFSNDKVAQEKLKDIAG